jgi:hypothetical protein
MVCPAKGSFFERGLPQTGDAIAGFMENRTGQTSEPNVAVRVL